MYLRQHGTGWRVEVEREGRRMSKTFAKKRDAQAWGHEQESKIASLGAGWRTFGQAVEAYKRSHTTQKKGQVWERRALDRLTEQIGADVPIADIDAPMIAAWRDQRLKTVSGSTVQRQANLLKHLLSVARKEWKWISVDPFEGVRLPSENEARYQVWSWPLIKRVLRARRTGKTAEVQRAFHIALRTGMRLAEVLAAPAGLDAKRRVVVLSSTKTGGRAEVPIGRIAADLIAGERFTVGANEASTLFSRLCRELLIDGLTFHDARATALTHLARKVDVLTLARISRHKDLKILMSSYYRETSAQIAARLR